MKKQTFKYQKLNFINENIWNQVSSDWNKIQFRGTNLCLEDREFIQKFVGFNKTSESDPYLC